jgi:outer membrane protein TolC
MTAVHRFLVRLLFVLSIALAALDATAQPPLPSERVPFQQAIDRAVRNNPSVAVAAAGILRAEGLLAQARAATRLQLTGNVTTTTLNKGVEFQGSTVTPQNQVNASLTFDMPIVAAANWARRAQAEDSRRVAELSSADIRRQIALATADAYLTIIAQQRVVDADTRARDTAAAHAALAAQLEQQGTGSRLNLLRAQQQVSTDDGLVEGAKLGLYRAQEALGVLIVAGGPVDADGDPSFDIPTDASEIASQPTNLAPDLLGFRTDLKLLTGQEQAAERVLRDSAKDRWPSLDAIFQPQSVYPSQFFVPANSWRFLLQATVPILDGGQRASLRVQRQATLDTVQANLTGAISQATAEVRAAREAVASGNRSLVSSRAAADQAQQVVTIVNVSFRAGAATNIEVIDAERTARDADTSVAASEDSLRRARLELLTALGRFP